MNTGTEPGSKLSGTWSLPTRALRQLPGHLYAREHLAHELILSAIDSPLTTLGSSSRPPPEQALNPGWEHELELESALPCAHGKSLTLLSECGARLFTSGFITSATKPPRPILLTLTTTTQTLSPPRREIRLSSSAMDSPTLLPQNSQRNTRPPSPRSLQPSTASHARQLKTPVMTGSGVQNTCHTFRS